MSIRIENGRIIERNIFGKEKTVGTVPGHEPEKTPTEIISNYIKTVSAMLEGLQETQAAIIQNQETILNNQGLLYEKMKTIIQEPEEESEAGTSKKKKE